MKKSKCESALSIETLRESFRYDPEAGTLHRLVWGKWREMVPDATYKSVIIKTSPGIYCTVSLHRLAWALHHGHWPEQEIDHINGDLKDIRLVNLQDISGRLNIQLAKTRQLKGVTT